MEISLFSVFMPRKDRYLFKESFENRFAGYSYLVEAKFNNGITVSDIFTVADESTLEKVVEAERNTKTIVSEVIKLSRIRGS